LDISFDKISSKIQLSSGQSEKAGGSEVGKEESAAVQETNKLSEEQIRLRNEREQMIIEAKRKYNFSFFKNFAFTGPDHLEMTQRSLEEYIINLESVQDI
jgi:hypothetical protein